MGVGRLRRAVPWLALSVLACATLAADLSRPVYIGVASTNLNGSLTDLAAELGLRLVCVLPETPGVGASAGPSNTPGVTAARAWEVLETLCARHRMNWWVERDTLMLRPVAEEGKRCHNAPAQGAMALLSSLTPAQRAAIYRGDLLPVSRLSDRQTEALIAAQANRSDRQDWDAIYGNYTNRCAFGIIFDPYVSVTTPIAVTRRYFYARGAASARFSVTPTGEDGVLRPVGSAIASAPPSAAAAPIGAALEIKRPTVLPADELLRRLSVIASRALDVDLDERPILLGSGTYAVEPLIGALGRIATAFDEDRQGKEMAGTAVERPRVGRVSAQFLPASPDILAGVFDVLTPAAHAAPRFTEQALFAKDAFLERRTILAEELSPRQRDWLKQVAPSAADAAAIRLGLGYLMMVARYGDAEPNGTRRADTAEVIQIAWDFPVYEDGSTVRTPAHDSDAARHEGEDGRQSHTEPQSEPRFDRSDSMASGFAGVADTNAPPMMPAQSALTLRPATPGVAPAVSAERAAQIAHQVAGIPPARVSPALVVFTDAESFDLGHREVLSWVVTLEPAAVASRPKASGDAVAAQRIAMRVAVDAASGYCMALFTECKAEWVRPYPTKRPESAVESVQSRGWRYARIEGDPKTKGIEVLTVVATEFGVDFASVGEVVVRPMVIDRDFPAIWISRIHGIEFVPLSPPVRAWIVATSGHITYDRGQHYNTEARHLVSDKDGKILESSFFR